MLLPLVSSRSLSMFFDALRFSSLLRSTLGLLLLLSKRLVRYSWIDYYAGLKFSSRSWKRVQQPFEILSCFKSRKKDFCQKPTLTIVNLLATDKHNMSCRLLRPFAACCLVRSSLLFNLLCTFLFCFISCEKLNDFSPSFLSWPCHIFKRSMTEQFDAFVRQL